MVSRSSPEEFYLVRYEDDDKEEFTEEDLRKIIIPMAATRVSALGDSDDESFEMSDKEQDDSSASDEEDSFLPRTPAQKSKSILPERSGARRSKPVPPSVVTPSPLPKKRKPRVPSSPRRVSTTKLTASSRTVAAGLPRGALARHKSGTLTIRALDSVPPTSLAENEVIPCGFTIVESAQSELLGKSFKNAKEFYKAWNSTKSHHTSPMPQITYGMEVIADPAFASWEYIHHRLMSSGLYKDDDDADDDGTESLHPYAITIDWDGRSCRTTSTVCWYREIYNTRTNKDTYQWSLIESDHREFPAIVVGVSRSLVADNHEFCVAPESTDDSEQPSIHEPRDGDFLPPLSTKTLKVLLPASLLQKSIRRGSTLSSSAPLLEACADLQLPSREPRDGSTLAMLRAIWGCMLVDASPFDDGDEYLGLPSLLNLTLIARADPSWRLPVVLRRAAVLSALITASILDVQPWIGYVRRDDSWWTLEKQQKNTKGQDAKSLHLRNLIRVCQVGAGGRVAWGKWDKFTGDTSAAAALAYLNNVDWQGSLLLPGPPCTDEMLSLVEAWEKEAISPGTIDSRIAALDDECRLASIDPSISPQSLVLLQALLPVPPTSWKKHSLPSLMRQLRKLIIEANPRIRERIQLARMATWGRERLNDAAKSLEKIDKLRASTIDESKHTTYKHVVTPTGELSEKELEVIECYESIQRLFFCTDIRKVNDRSSLQKDPCDLKEVPKITIGPPLTSFQGRVAFLLAFAEAVELEIVPDRSRPSEKETISVMFCGDPDEPLLVQRIGKARREGQGLATTGGATSGAAAIPSLGYVQEKRSLAENAIMKAAEVATAEYWKCGRNTALPLLPPGMQWEVSGGEFSALRTAELLTDRTGRSFWHFSIAGVKVDAFDARPVVSPCALDLQDTEHMAKPLQSVPERYRALSIALYCSEYDETGKMSVPSGQGSGVLNALVDLHAQAVDGRVKLSNGESTVLYDWMPLALKSPIPSRTWRDALLAIRTRDKNHVYIGRGINANGSGAPRDMTEGVLLRIYHALEMLYPSVIKKEAAMKFLVIPKGGPYYHLLMSLEKLGRGQNISEPKMSKLSGHKRKAAVSISPPKRPRRAAAAAARQLLCNDFVNIDDDGFNIQEEDIAKQRSGEEAFQLPTIKTPLWPHQEACVAKVMEGVQNGKRGHADASAVGAGKTLTALAAIVRVARWMHASGEIRKGVLCMLPNKALIREWLLEIATHTQGFHVIEQREDGSLFSLTYAKSHPPIDANAIIISTLDRVCRHPFVRQTSWDFVIVDECLSVQNAAAKRNPSAWRQIEISQHGVLMLSATFFRSKYDQLFYMIRMLRSPLPPSLPWLPATIHEHIVCQVPETDRSWTMRGEFVALPPKDLDRYKGIVEAFKRKQINKIGESDGRKLWVDLESFLRQAYEGRSSKHSYNQGSLMSDAFSRVAKSLLSKGRRPLIFADTSQEANFLVTALQANGLSVCTWANVTSVDSLTSTKLGKKAGPNARRVIVAVKSVEGQGINMQHHADAIICRPTPGDHLEQMKGRVDRPGQSAKELLLVVVVAEHTIEEAKFANIRLAGNFFREYLAPVASKYRERIDLEATLSVAGVKKLKKGTVTGTWMRSVEAAGQSGAFCSARLDEKSSRGSKEGDNMNEDHDDGNDFLDQKTELSPVRRPLNKVIRNKGDPEAVRQAKELARKGHASTAVQDWLFRSKASNRVTTSNDGSRSLPKTSLLRFSDTSPPLVLDHKTIHKAVAHLSKNDPKMGTLIARVGVDAIFNDVGMAKVPTQALLFDRCIRAITFTMVSVDAGNAFLRRLAIKIGVSMENTSEPGRKNFLKTFFQDVTESGNKSNISNPQELLELLLKGHHNYLSFTPGMLRVLVDDCEPTGHPHLCGPSYPCGKNDDHAIFLQKAREVYQKSTASPVSAGFSMPKASFLIALLKDFESGKISAAKIAKASDRQAADMLMNIKGIGDWCAGGILMNFLSRADIMLYGDLTIRNYLNDLYDINHSEESETLLESAADFADNATNRNLIDQVSKANNWEPYRSVVCLLMYHLQEENLVLL